MGTTKCEIISILSIPNIMLLILSLHFDIFMPILIVYMLVNEEI